MTSLSQVAGRHLALGGSTIVCFSHLRWDFVFQRPQHLMTRFAKEHEVMFWEEHIYCQQTAVARLDVRKCDASNVVIITPVLPENTDRALTNSILKTLLHDKVASVSGTLIAWYYTPMMLAFSEDLKTSCTVYDCMDALENFLFAPAELVSLEAALMKKADVVFTGGYSLFEAKRSQHENIHPFPSSVDIAHFAQARTVQGGPLDQADLPHPRLGFYGVIDERMDLALIDQLATERPDYSLVLVGPVVKIDHDTLPKRPNIHWLGSKSYTDLPQYLSGWDAAIMPFAINDATRFISPTKTPEYLAAGCPVITTPITDVVRHYGHLDAVLIGDNATAFIAACDAALALQATNNDWLETADEVLAGMSWDQTQAAMAQLIGDQIMKNKTASLSLSAANSDREYDYVIVGAGFAGSVMAERLASVADKKVLVIDRRDHIAGNAFDRLDEAGILIHQYGPHIFHTNSDEIFAYLSQFTAWTPYEHRVLAEVDNMLVPMPINRTTINSLYGLSMTSDAEVDAFLSEKAEQIDVVRTSADVVLSKVGRDLYEKFFQGYTRKQWGLDPSELDKSVTARVPTRSNTDDRYFTDKHQAMPKHGYTKMFERMLDHPNIDIELGLDYKNLPSHITYDKLVFSGPVDEYFDFRFGQLPYRSLEFRHVTEDVEQFQAVATVNYPNEAVPYTRITEYKHLTGQKSDRTSLTYEYPCEHGDPYYPIPRPENQILYKRYEELADATEDVIFVGRLATYRYYNMDQVVGQSLATFRRLNASAEVIAANTLPAMAKAS